ncbi:MAG: hypothetical protein H7Y60_09155 [Rhodospirillaceae bacterium]|nr:hypothetical protein [Rhodospirillales bacterium]
MRKLLQIIDAVRDNPEALNDYGYLSTAEWLIVCMGVGTPEAIAALKNARYPTIPDAWTRIGSSGQQIVLEAWGAV